MTHDEALGWIKVIASAIGLITLIVGLSALIYGMFKHNED